MAKKKGKSKTFHVELRRRTTETYVLRVRGAKDADHAMKLAEQKLECWEPDEADDVHLHDWEVLGTWDNVPTSVEKIEKEEASR
jgi:hypothetical protein